MGENNSSAWYRKYRSQNFAELMGQPHVTSSLDNAIKNNKISHAYLFAGPRGTGKTSAARIFAYQVNKLDKNITNHLDIIEIDAASNRRIEEIRDLRSKVHSAPAQAPYKVYIIDEAHMLTTEAFNALLKTLEEPPSHVIFILATTEPHKLPETIISRTQRFNFRPLSEEVIATQLKLIADKEKLKYEDEAIELIALSAEGSMRDGVSLLDQLATTAHTRKLTFDMVSQQLGMADKTHLNHLMRATLNGDLQALVTGLDELIAQGVNVHQFSRQLVDYLRTLMKAIVHKPDSKTEFSLEEVTGLLKLLAASLGGGVKSWSILEAILVDLCLNRASTHATAAHVPNPVKKPSRAVEAVIPAVEAKTAPKTAKGKGATISASDWDKILSYIKSHHNSLYALLKAADPKFNPGQVVLTFRFQFHKRRLEEPKNRNLLAKAIENQLGQVIDIDTALNAKLKPTPAQNAVDSVLEMLGGEVIKDDS